MSFLPKNYYQNTGRKVDSSMIIGARGWFVESDSNPGMYYLVEKNKRRDVFTCTCMDSSVRNKECKHCERVKNRFRVI